MIEGIKLPITIASVFLWIGFVCAISFMEAWIKFKAPGVNLQIGLGIGRLVFSALNKMEWVFATAILIDLFIPKVNVLLPNNIWFYIPVIILIIQTIWLLPALDKRAEMHINLISVPPSNLHFCYVAFEIIKVTALIIFSIKFFK